MVLSKRERLIAIAVVAVLGVLALDQIVVSPLLARSDDLDAQIMAAQEDMLEAQDLFRDSRRRGREWALVSRDALKRNASEAEGQLLTRVREWAQDAGVGLTSLKPERDEKLKDFRQITLRATATGSVSTLGQFLHRIETATVPVRITDMTIATRKEGTDELTLNLGVATIYLPPETAEVER